MHYRGFWYCYRVPQPHDATPDLVLSQGLILVFSFYSCRMLQVRCMGASWWMSERMIFLCFKYILKFKCHAWCFWLAFLHHILWKQRAALFKEIQSCSSMCVYTTRSVPSLGVRKKGWGGGSGHSGAPMSFGALQRPQERATLRWRSG